MRIGYKVLGVAAVAAFGILFGMKQEYQVTEEYNVCPFFFECLILFQKLRRERIRQELMQEIEKEKLVEKVEQKMKKQ